MSLTHASIRKIMTASFKQKTPMKVELSERQTLGEQINDRLAGLTYVKVDEQPYSMRAEEKDRFVTSFAIQEPSNRYYSSWSNTWFRLLVNEQGQLVIRDYLNEYLVSSLDELVDFVINCQERVDRRVAQKNKRKKIREFKAQAIIAQVKKIAQEEQFAYYTETDTIKLKLYVKMSDKKFAKLDIPFKSFQEILPHLRATIQGLMMMHAQGINVTIKSMNTFHWRDSKWMEPESSSDNDKTLS